MILSALRTENNHKTAVMFQKVPFQQGTAELDYIKYLTFYVAGFVFKHLELVSKVKDIKDDGSGQCYKLQTSADEVQVSKFDCECIFHQSMPLSCPHMLALRKMLGKPLYDLKICDNQWTFAYSNQHKEFLLVLHHEPLQCLSQRMLESSAEMKSIIKLLCWHLG